MGPKVVILGAGYAGVSAAKRLSRADAQVTVVNQRVEFVERIRLHQFVSGTHEAVSSLESILPPAVDLTIGTAKMIDAHGQCVHLDNGHQPVEYDYLIYAIGSHSRTDVIPGSKEFAVTLGTWDDALRARRQLHQLPHRSTLTIVGGGLTGIETAAELAETTEHWVRLICDKDIGESVGNRARNHLRRYLATVGVDIIENIAVTRIDYGHISLADGSVLPSDLNIDVAAVGVPITARQSGLATNPSGTLALHDNLVSTTSPTIVGAGDAAAFSESPLRMSCQSAIPTGVHAAETVLHLAAGSEPKVLRRKYTGQCISLGRRHALFQTTNRRDRPRDRILLTGAPAAVIKEQLCMGTMRFGHFGSHSYSWS